MSPQPLIGVGFWRSLFEPLLPDPAGFVNAAWAAPERDQALAYLRRGRPLNAWMGSSWCRFGCGEPRMGAADLTDGTYCWPEGLAHYLEKHQVRLPAEIIGHIVAQPAFPTAHARQAEEFCLLDMRWWLTQQGWTANISDFSQGSAAADQELLRRFDRNLIDFGPESEATREARRQLLAVIREKWA